MNIVDFRYLYGIDKNLYDLFVNPLRSFNNDYCHKIYLRKTKAVKINAPRNITVRNNFRIFTESFDIAKKLNISYPLYRHILKINNVEEFFDEKFNIEDVFINRSDALNCIETLYRIASNKN